jgi:hypothetical protein
MYRRQSSGQAVIAVEEILASRGAGPGRCFCSGALAYGFEQRSASLPVGSRHYRNQPHGFVSVPGQDYFVTGLGAAYEFGQLSLCFSNGNPQRRSLSNRDW